MLSVVREYKDYSVLGHMDLIARYDEKGVYPFEKIKPIVEEICKCHSGWERSGSEYIVIIGTAFLTRRLLWKIFKTVQRAWRKRSSQ